MFPKCYDIPRANAKTMDPSDIRRPLCTMTANLQMVAAYKKQHHLPADFYLKPESSVELPNGILLFKPGCKPQPASQSALDAYFVMVSELVLGKRVTGTCTPRVHASHHVLKRARTRVSVVIMPNLRASAPRETSLGGLWGY